MTTEVIDAMEAAAQVEGLTDLSIGIAVLVVGVRVLLWAVRMVKADPFFVGKRTPTADQMNTEDDDADGIPAIGGVVPRAAGAKPTIHVARWWE